ncbi:MAG: hypothetical protein NC343_06725 [Muribaculum sp.]|nr:hypothetical protein [Muribaculaceae bacterium]MCM1081429.1 hypothetical protein [Muribaculum sp.]
MKLRSLLYIALAATSLSAAAQSVITPAEAAAILNDKLQQTFAVDTLTDGEHEFNIDSIRVAIVTTKKGKIAAARQKLFSQPMLESPYGGSLRYVEEAALYSAFGVQNPRFDKIKFITGTWLDITPGCEIQISVPDRNEIQVAWLTDSTETALLFPTQYQDIIGGDRANIENDFISLLKNSDIIPRTIVHPDTTRLLQSDSLTWVLPGTQYNLPEVNNNLYFISSADSVFTPVNSNGKPYETIANMLVGAVPDSCEATVELVAVKHKFGDLETVTVPLEKLIALAVEQGCRPFCGIEETTNGTVTATLFLYNQPQGYDHILRLSIPESQIGTNRLKMKGRISLFVPTANVQNLFEPYKEKKPDEILENN